jgi:hypothetical protein
LMPVWVGGSGAARDGKFGMRELKS